MPAIRLTPDQETQIREWIWAGATIEQAHRRAEEAGWRCSASKVGQLAREARLMGPPERPEGAAEDAESGAGVLQRLERLEQRLSAIQSAPSETLEQAAVGAVVQCRRLSQDPGVDPRVQVMALDKLPQLIRLAKEIQEANRDDGGGIWSPEVEAEASAPA